MSDSYTHPRATVPFDQEVDSMSDVPRGDSNRPRRRRRRRRHAKSRDSGRGERAGDEDLTPTEPGLERARELHSLDESLVSEDERAYVEAHRRAEEKVRLMRDISRPALINLALLIFVPPAGFGYLIYNIWSYGRRVYRVLIEPEIRDRFVDGEVSKRLDARVQAQRRAMEGEHARSLEKLSASIAHEIRNPITAAKSLVQQMGEEPRSPENVEYAQVALSELERVERSVSHLLRFARDEEMRPQEVSLSDVLDSALETFRERAEREYVSVTRSFDSAGMVRGDAEKLRRVAINLIGNAIDALVESDVVDRSVEVAMGENLAGTEVWFRVKDNGPGIESEIAKRIFDPFYTSKQSGTGLGLPITRKLVEAHGGEIELITDVGQGTEFVVTFPKEGNGGIR
ncbi:MAG: HAMP domain-containing sensor histidine kinase [Myxococcota bacterium]|nr:HAMP domain-containing sensor histidine kinase [Myxococcota bacterium]